MGQRPQPATEAQALTHAGVRWIAHMWLAYAADLAERVPQDGLPSQQGYASGSSMP